MYEFFWKATLREILSLGNSALIVQCIRVKNFIVSFTAVRYHWQTQDSLSGDFRYIMD